MSALRSLSLRPLRTATAVAAALAPVLVFGSSCVLRGHSFFVFPDAQQQTFAWMQKLTRSLHEGHMPLWDPNILSGHSFPGELQAGVFYPLNLLWAVVFGSAEGISVRALDALVLVHFAFASLGMFVLLAGWSLRTPAALLGALVFACLGAPALRAASQPNIFHGLCWMPWAVWALTRHFDSGRKRYAVLAGGLLAMQIVAGHGQPAFHTAVLLAALGLGWTLRGTGLAVGRWLALLRAGALVGAATLLLAGPQLLLSAQYLADAYRWVGASKPIGPGERVPFEVFAYKHIVEPRGFLSLFDPWGEQVDDANTLYAGTVVLFLVTWFLCVSPARASVTAFAVHGRWLLAVAAAAVVCILGHHTFVPAVLRLLPVVGEIRELGRYVILFHFSMSALAAMAFHALLQGGPLVGKRPIAAFGLMTAAILLLLIWIARMRGAVLSPTAVGQLAIAVVPLAATSFSQLRWFVPGLVGLALVVHVVAFSELVLHRPRPGKDAETQFAGGPVTAALADSWGRYRVDIQPGVALPVNYAEAHRLQTKLGYGATMDRPYFDFIARDWSEESEVNRLLNVRYLVSGEERQLPLVAEDPVRGLKVYELRHWYPRVFLRSQLTMRPDGAAIERAIAFQVEEYGDQVQRFRLTGTTADEAIVSEIAYPGWCATVNGLPAPIRRASIGGRETPLRVVSVPAGENVLEFRYRPFRAMVFGCGVE